MESGSYDLRRWSDRRDHSRGLNVRDSSYSSDSSSSSSQFSNESDSDFSDTPKKSKKNWSGTTHRGGQSHPRKSYTRDDLGSFEYQNAPRQHRKTRGFSDSSETDSSSDWYSDEENGGGRRDPLTYYAESSSESSSSSESDDDLKTREEYKGPQIEKVLGQNREDPEQLYVKYKDENERMRRCWMTSDEVKEVHNGEGAMKTFQKKQGKLGLEDMSAYVPNLMMLRDVLCRPEFFQVARVFAYDSELDSYYVLWEGFDYDEATWQHDVADLEAVEEFKRREARRDEALELERRQRVMPRVPRRYVPYGEDPKLIEEGKMLKLPEFKNEGKLRDYQIDGLNWLRECWCEGRSSILADEMGLGKTVQGTCMVNEIARLGYRGPFLILAPKSTLNQWKREFKEWTDLNVIGYYGKKEARKVISDYEFYWGDCREIVKFEVLIVNYELLLQDEVYELLSGIKWEYMIVDEAHKLKNEVSKTYAKVQDLEVNRTLLMTGTPVQNNARELWALLHLVDKRRFDDMEAFVEEMDISADADISDKERERRITRIKEVIKPYMLRRTKDYVEHSIGSKEEVIVFVELTRTQKELYRTVLKEKVSKFPSKGKKTDDLLAKICNHPYWYFLSESNSIDVTRIYPKERGDDASQLILCCGKMIFVDKLLRQLHERGEQVLIFSQIKKILDFLEELCKYKGYSYERIDGEKAANERQQAVDRFTHKQAEVFLLSTRSAGQGLNLTAATCVVMYDTDWNPQNDSQAKARSHRIGQDKDVTVYRLISRHTYEMEKYIRATRKMEMGQAILSEGNQGILDFDGPQHDSESELSKLKLEVYYNGEKFDSTIDDFQAEDITTILKNRAVKCDNETEFLRLIQEDEAPQDDIDKAYSEFKEWVESTKNATEADFTYGKRERKQTKRYTDAIDNWSSIASKVCQYLRDFGYPSNWDRLEEVVKDVVSNEELENGCAVMVWIAV